MLSFKILLFTTILAIILGIISYPKGTHKQHLLAFGILIILSTVFYKFFGLQYDSAIYFQNSLNYIFQPGYESEELNWTKSVYPKLLSLIYDLFGVNVLIGGFLNSFILCNLAVLYSYTNSNFNLMGANYYTPWIMFIYPPFLYYGITINRDMISFWIIALSVFGLSNIYKGMKSVGFLILSISLAISFSWREYLPLFILIMIFVYFLHSRISRANIRLNFKSKIVLILFAIIFIKGIFVLVHPNQLDNLQSLMNSNSQPTVSTALDLPNIRANLIPVNFLINYLSSLFGPFYSSWNTFAMITYGVIGLLHLFILLVIGLVLSSVNSLNSNVYYVLLVTFFVCTLGNSITLANYGLNFRIIINFFIFILPLYTHALYILSSRAINASKITQ
jgi:hypothetical protein